MKIWLLTLMLACACHARQEQKTIAENPVAKKNNQNPAEIKLNFTKEKNYDATKASIVQSKQSLYASYQKKKTKEEKAAFLDSVSVYISESIVHRLIPHWYGTKWEFTGHTAVPNKGTIACGYFVSTTLKDAGFVLNRYTLAQQNPENEGKSIAIKADNRVSYAMSLPGSVLTNLQNQGEGLYFVGLGNHVGYLYKKADMYYFIHSNYISGKVEAELADESIAFYSYQYHFTKITGNRALALKWLKGEEIKVVVQ